MSRPRANTDVHDPDDPVSFKHVYPITASLSAAHDDIRVHHENWIVLWGRDGRNGKLSQLFASRDRSGSRIGLLEQENEALRARVLGLEASATDQGQRLGKVEKLALKAMLAVAALVPTVNFLMDRFGG